MVDFKKALARVNEVKYRFFRRFYDASVDDYVAQHRNHTFRRLERYDSTKGRGKWHK